MWLLCFAKLTALLPLWLIYRVRARALKNIRGGACIIAANHGSMWDPILFNIALPTKRIYFLCAKRLFECPRICRAFLRLAGAIPVFSPVDAMNDIRRRALKLKRRERIGFFAQGEISEAARAFRPGVALLALETGLPLVPAYIRSRPFYKGGSVIYVGERIPVIRQPSPSEQSVLELTEKLHREVIALCARSQSGKNR